MKNSEAVKMSVDPEIGVVLEFADREVADAFDDYLTEKRFVLFKLQETPGGLRFLFGEASAADRVSALLGDFNRASEINAWSKESSVPGTGH